MGLICTVLGIWCAGQSIVGYPRVIDGDTLAFGAMHVRLWGIDAPEMNEREGRQSRNTMIAMIAAYEVKCTDTGEPKSHDRIVARCRVDAPMWGKPFEVNAEMVRSGAALDCAKFSKGAYRSLEPTGVRDRIKQQKYCQ